MKKHTNPYLIVRALYFNLPCISGSVKTNLYYSLKSRIFDIEYIRLFKDLFFAFVVELVNH